MKRGGQTASHRGRNKETEKKTQGERVREGEAGVALVTGILHHNDFNRSSDTQMHARTHTQILSVKTQTHDEQLERRGKREKEKWNKKVSVSPNLIQKCVTKKNHPPVQCLSVKLKFETFHICCVGFQR